MVEHIKLQKQKEVRSIFHGAMMSGTEFTVSLKKKEKKKDLASGAGQKRP